MADNFSKLWLQKSQNELAINRAAQEIKRQGRALPCRVTNVSGSIVTVEFQMDTSPWTLPPVTIPKAESPWIRMPTQVGDLGYTAPADVYIGGISGLGGGIARFLRRGNLSNLIFTPVSNAESGPIDPNAAQLQGPNGAIIRTTTGPTSSIVTNSSGTTITFESTTLVINASGITLTVDGQTFTWGGTQAVSTLPIKAPDVILPNGAVNGHNHGNVQNGGGVTDPMAN